MKGIIKTTNKIKFDLIAIDALNYCYKYFFVYKNLYNKNRDWTGLYYGFFQKINQLKKEHSGSKIIVAWDRESTVRKKINSDYKANRSKEKEQKMDKELKELRKMLSWYGVYQYYKNGYEADDVIAKLVDINLNKKILVLTSDKDLFQLLSENVFIARKKNAKSKERIYNKEEIEFDFNIKVENYTLYKAIIGDKGDNVFGVFRINKFEVKKFVNFIDGDVSRIYSITGMKKFKKIKSKIIMNFGKIEENYELVKLYTDFDLKNIEIKIKSDQLIKKFEKYEMKEALKELI